MRFILYCKHDPVELGIEDHKGNWDMEKFLDHIRRCRECSRFLNIMGAESLNKLAEAKRAAEGSQKSDCPQLKEKAPHERSPKQWKAYHG